MKNVPYRGLSDLSCADSMGVAYPVTCRIYDSPSLRLRLRELANSSIAEIGANSSMDSMQQPNIPINAHLKGSIQYAHSKFGTCTEFRS